MPGIKMHSFILFCLHEVHETDKSIVSRGQNKGYLWGNIDGEGWVGF